MNEIEEFIKRRFDKDCHWLDGNCYYFALMLCFRFPYLKKIYYPIEGHWVVTDSEYAYDFNGKSEIGDIFYSEEEWKREDKSFYDEVISDCTK